MVRHWKLALLVLLVIGLFVAGRYVELESLIATTRDWVRGFGPWGPLVYVGVYVVATVLALPGTPFTILAALLFGNLLGFGVMVAASTASASACFLLARYAAREAVRARLAQNCGGLVARLERTLAQSDWFVVPAVQIAPFLPSSLTNYAFGVSRIPFWRYLLWSELAMVPMNAVWVFGSNAVYGAAGGNVSWGLFAATAGISAALVAGGLVARRLLART